MLSNEVEEYKLALCYKINIHVDSFHHAITTVHALFEMCSAPTHEKVCGAPTSTELEDILSRVPSMEF